MKYLNQIVPRLSRSLGLRQEGDQDATETEFFVKPAYELNESADAWNLSAHLPGVTKDTVEISAEDSLIRIRGRRNWVKPEAWTAVYRESLDAPFELVFEHDNVVDAEKIQAEYRDGVLRVTLPKAEAVKPRKIAIN